jgi:serine/threonine protein phosphatase 1
MNRLFAISDIHGCFTTFYELILREIDLKRTDQLVLLGDYIDRGEQSKEVIDFIIDLQKKGFNIVALRGNHEQMLLDSYHNPEELSLWFFNSGETTLMSFGITDIRDIGNKYLDFFTRSGFYHQIGDLFFVHAGFNDLLKDPLSDNYHMIWECRPSYSSLFFDRKTIVHGHRPKHPDYVKKLIKNQSRVIPIDTGCVYGPESGYGYLSALEINSKELISLPLR